MSELGLESWELRCGEFRPDCILDLRPESQYSRGHIAGALNMPYNVFQADSEAHTEGRTAILLVDGAGARAAEMAVWLRQRGRSARYLIGGMSGWRGPLEKM